MRIIIIATAAALVLIAGPALADDYVNGYYRADGHYVQPYHRTSPDNSLFNNYSTQGNTNPYTLQPGTRNPYGHSTPGTIPSGPYGAPAASPYLLR